MKRNYIVAALMICASSVLFGCRISVVNDLESTVFVFDEGSNTGNIIPAGKKAFYGSPTTHPDVVVYIPATPDDTSFKKSYHIKQIACAVNEEDRVITLSAAIGDTYNKGIYEVVNLATGMGTLSCCGHHGSPIAHEEAAGELVIDIDED